MPTQTATCVTLQIGCDQSRRVKHVQSVQSDRYRPTHRKRTRATLNANSAPPQNVARCDRGSR